MKIDEDVSKGFIRFNVEKLWASGPRDLALFKCFSLNNEGLILTLFAREFAIPTPVAVRGFSSVPGCSDGCGAAAYGCSNEAIRF